jgi:hypothetical protein
MWQKGLNIQSSMRNTAALNAQVNVTLLASGTEETG